jgi:hypothetical protein
MPTARTRSSGQLILIWGFSVLIHTRGFWRIVIEGGGFLLNVQNWANPFSRVAVPRVVLTTILYENAPKMQVLVLREHMVQVYV